MKSIKKNNKIIDLMNAYHNCINNKLIIHLYRYNLKLPIIPKIEHNVKKMLIIQDS